MSRLYRDGVRAQKSRGDHRTDFEGGVHDFRRASPLRLETPAQANYNGKIEPYKGAGSKGERRRRTVPVDSFEPNSWGLYNVQGNAWEWIEDCWNDSNTGNPGDGRARTGDCTRVRKGSQPGTARVGNLRTRLCSNFCHRRMCAAAA